MQCGYTIRKRCMDHNIFTAICLLMFICVLVVSFWMQLLRHTRFQYFSRAVTRCAFDEFVGCIVFYKEELQYRRHKKTKVWERNIKSLFVTKKGKLTTKSVWKQVSEQRQMFLEYEAQDL